MGSGGRRTTITNCSGCGRYLDDEERWRAHDLTISDRIERKRGSGATYRSTQVAIHALLCDECAERLRSVVVAELVGDDWRRGEED